MKRVYSLKKICALAYGKFTGIQELDHFVNLQLTLQYIRKFKTQGHWDVKFKCWNCLKLFETRLYLTQKEQYNLYDYYMLCPPVKFEDPPSNVCGVECASLYQALSL